ncbi:MAG: hypothetical protein ACK6CT_06710 [Planctomycetia bacterium]|jgi:hypothetical protein
MNMILENVPDCDDVTPSDVVRAMRRIADPRGPTFVILEDSDGNYVQAAGTDGRYIVESRTVYGEGFQHYRLYQPITGPDAADVVYHRQKCDRHPPRRCPLRVRRSEVFDLGTVEVALLAFLQTGERAPSLLWREVTEDMIAKAAHRGDDDEITEIRPRSR